MTVLAYIYGYLNRIQSSRRLEREAQRKVELAPDFKTIADLRHDNAAGIRNVCRRFVGLCRDLKLFSHAIVAIDGSKFKAVNSRDRNFTPGKLDARQRQIEQSIQRYLDALEMADARSLQRSRPRPSGYRTRSRAARWEHEDVTERVQQRMDLKPMARRCEGAPWSTCSEH